MRGALAVLGLLALTACVCGQPASAPSSKSDDGFIQAIGTDFARKDCSQYVFSGANVWQLIDSQAGVSGSPADVDKLFSIAKQNGLNSIRFFPFGILGNFKLINSPGNYNPQAFAALDAIIKKAGDNGIKLVMPFSDNWTPVNGKINFVEWAIPGETNPDTFFTDERVKTLYKNYIRDFLNHVNSQTGLAYKDDPTILSFNLINEVRSACNTSAPNVSCTAEATAYVQQWIQEISSFVKTIDSNHMLTTGEEGFWPRGERADKYNPGQLFAVGSAQDFVNNHNIPSIDYAVTHIWVDNWVINATQCTINNNPSCGADFVTKWIQAHVEDANAMNKPFVIEEFGNQAYTQPADLMVRNPIFQAGYGPYLKGLQGNGPTDISGIAFWQWVYAPGINTDYAANDYAVRTDDGTWRDVIKPSFGPTTAFNNARKPVANCVPGATKATRSGAASAPSSSSAGRRLKAT